MITMVTFGTPGSPAWVHSRVGAQAVFAPDLDKDIKERMVSQIKQREDLVHISDTGMRLMIGGKKAGGNWERVTDSGASEKLQLLDRGISIAGKLLKQMREVAVSALDKSLDDEARIKLQIEIGRLQHDFNVETAVIGSVLLETSSEEEARALMGDSQGSFYESEACKMLERAYDRILGGEDWDVAELMSPIVELDQRTDKYLETGEFAWEKTDNADVLTAGEILKIMGRSVMDVKAAAVSKNELEKNLNSLAGLKRNLTTFIERNGADSQDSYAADELFIMAGNTAVALETFRKKSFWVTYGLPKKIDEEWNVVPVLPVENRKLIIGDYKMKDENGNIVPMILTPELEAKLEGELKAELDAKKARVTITSFDEENIFSKSGNAPVSDESILALSEEMEAMSEEFASLKELMKRLAAENIFMLNEQRLGVQVSIYA